jgi:acylphosphatase
VEGLVQGVGYRAWLKRRALSRSLGGWTRNREDGSVEAVLIGPADKVGEALELMKSVGRIAKSPSSVAIASSPGSAGSP